MYIGEFSHTMDVKGRTTIPMKFRGDLGETFFIGKGFDECLFVFDREGWDNFVDKLLNAKTSGNKKTFRFLQRTIFSSTIECTLDKQGRVLIPNNLRKYAGLEKEIVFIGVSGRAEIWSKASWESYNDGFDEDITDLSDLADSLDDFDF